MTQEQFIVILFGILGFTYIALFTKWANKKITEAKQAYQATLKYYQDPETQRQITSHVLANNMLRNGEEVFK